MNFFERCIAIVFPVHCLGCRRSGSELCQTCLAKIPGARIPYYQSIHACLDYRHPTIRKAVRVLKRRRSVSLAKVFAEKIHEYLTEELGEQKLFTHFDSIILIPIPVYKSRARERGFNQAELIAREVAKLDPLYNVETKVLYKSHATKKQALVSDKRLRMQNVQNSFAIKYPEKIKGTFIIVIDDVTTTGATLHEAIKVLRKTGAKKVLGIAVAH